jgi:hypothetical protein
MGAPCGDGLNDGLGIDGLCNGGVPFPGKRY